MKTRGIEIGKLLLLVTLLSAVVFPANLFASYRSYVNIMVNNLRQIDGAIQQWALENKHDGTVKVTAYDLAPYLKTEIQPIAGEKYILTTVKEPPHVVLTRKVEGYPIGTVINLPGVGAESIVMPPNTHRDGEHGIVMERIVLCSVIGLFAICAAVFLVKRFVR